MKSRSSIPEREYIEEMREILTFCRIEMQERN